MNTFEHEPIRGLPEPLPPGEHILWQGSPSWTYLARHTFRVRGVAFYFCVFVVLRGMIAGSEGSTWTEALLSASMVIPLAALGVGILTLMAWAHARTTLYTLTNRRVVLRYGIALPMMVNLPFKALISASFRERSEGRGDLPMRLAGGHGPSYLHLWPHARPWRVSHPEPMLRGIPNVRAVAQTFAEALGAYRESSGPEGLGSKNAFDRPSGGGGSRRPPLAVPAL